LNAPFSQDTLFPNLDLEDFAFFSPISVDRWSNSTDGAAVVEPSLFQSQ